MPNLPWLRILVPAVAWGAIAWASAGAAAFVPPWMPSRGPLGGLWPPLLAFMIGLLGIMTLRGIASLWTRAPRALNADLPAGPHRFRIEPIDVLLGLGFVAAQYGVLDLYRDFYNPENQAIGHDNYAFLSTGVEQLSHGQAIAEDCVHTKPRKLRSKLNVWLQDKLLREDTEGVEATLAALGFKTVMVRPDLFTNRHAERFIDQLKAVDPRPTRVNDRGVYAVMFTVTGDASADPRAVLADVKPSEQPQVSRRNWQGAIHHGRYNGPVAVVAWLLIGAVLLVTRRRRS